MIHNSYRHTFVVGVLLVTLSQSKVCAQYFNLTYIYILYCHLHSIIFSTNLYTTTLLTLSIPKSISSLLNDLLYMIPLESKAIDPSRYDDPRFIKNTSSLSICHVTFVMSSPSYRLKYFITLGSTSPLAPPPQAAAHGAIPNSSLS